MPTIDNPGHFERSSYMAAGRADEFLKWIDLDECVSDTGSVESPFGHLSLVHITRDMIATWVSSQGDPWMSEWRNFEPGWYIIKTDDNGLVWGIGYGSDTTLNEEKARADFSEAEIAYGNWLGEGEHDDTDIADEDEPDDSANPHLHDETIGLRAFNLVPGAAFMVVDEPDPRVWIVERVIREENFERVYVWAHDGTNLQDHVGSMYAHEKAFSLDYNTTVALVGLVVNPTDQDDNDWGV